MMKKYFRYILFPLAGGVLGYAYYYFWGCKNGCPLQSNWLTMSAYGAMAGLVLSFPSKKKETGEQRDGDRKDNSD
jgi:hypothetical protein